MKKFSKLLCIVLSTVMLLAVVLTVVACGNKDNQSTETVTVTYQNGTTQIAQFEVPKGEKITDLFMPGDPVPAADKKFKFWSAKDDATDYIKNGTPNENITLYATFEDRAENEVVVTFDSDGGARVASQVVLIGNKASKPSNPANRDASAKFRNWKDTENGKQFTFEENIMVDTLLIATWEEGNGRVLSFSSTDFDKVFSPFFSTSAADASVYGQTHVSMLAADPSGKPYVGEDVPSVVKAYNLKTYYYGNLVPKEGLEEEPNDTEKINPDIYHTEYRFVIKNGIMLSDGKTPLTINDVLFNMYVYLDRVYAGSNTMYSTNIVGLNAYRTQQPGATSDDSKAALQNANARRGKLNSYYDSNYTNRISYRQNLSQADKMEILSDVKLLREYLWEDLESLYTSAQSIEDIRKDYEEYGFDSVWQVFLLNCGIIVADYNNDGTVNRFGEQKDGYVNGININGTDTWKHDEQNLIKSAFNYLAGIAIDGQTTLGQDQLVDLEFDNDTGKVIGNIFENGNASNDNKLFWKISQSNTMDSQALNLLYGWTCGNKLFSKMISEEDSKILLGMQQGGADGEYRVPLVEGIKVEKLNKGETFEDQNGNTKEYDEDHYVLFVDIVGVDPKALWNFGFIVAPMKYYSDPVGKSDNFVASDGYSSFNYPGAIGYTSTKPIRLGFKQFTSKYFDEVLNNIKVQALPFGAGPFVATDSSYKNDIASGNLSASAFCSSDTAVYFKRNNYFESTGAAMNNVKFERMNYKVVETSMLMTQLTQKAIDVGDPNPKQSNKNIAINTEYLTHAQLSNNGYGYVGINAGKIPDIGIRRAIFTALQPSLALSYYEGGLAKALVRPMSMSNFAYPHQAEPYYKYPQGSEQDVVDYIKGMVAAAGYDGTLKRGNTLGKSVPNEKDRYLEYEFTIAGSSTDHPAQSMFTTAKTLLEQCGFKITVKNDAQALSRLASGELTVWAAAWSTAIDPDMFQLYHKKSKAQAVKNWGYPYLIDEGKASEEEETIIENLSKKIDEGRSTTNEDLRIIAYASALDLVMDLAVEYPTYQRDNLTIYNNEKVDGSTLNSRANEYSGLFDFIWKVKLLK